MSLLNVPRGFLAVVGIFVFASGWSPRKMLIEWGWDEPEHRAPAPRQPRDG